MKFKKITYLIFIFILSTIFFTLSNLYVLTNNNNVLNKIIVLDAGHGGEDGGASSKEGTLEKDLNLAITLKVKQILEKKDFKVILTRENDSSLDQGEENISKRKVSDLNNRIKIINNSNADMVVSIHMNSFPQEKYYGWQTFYKANCIYSKEIATNIQNCIKNNIDIENNRVTMEIKNIKIIEKSTIPAILVECGFLSNKEESERLKDEEYQNKLANGICQGIIMWYEK